MKVRINHNANSTSIRKNIRSIKTHRSSFNAHIVLEHSAAALYIDFNVIFISFAFRRFKTVRNEREERAEGVVIRLFVESETDVMHGGRWRINIYIYIYMHAGTLYIHCMCHNAHVNPFIYYGFMISD